MHQGHLSLISMLTLLHGFLNEFPAQKRKENKTLLLWRNISKRMVNNVYQWQVNGQVNPMPSVRKMTKQTSTILQHLLQDF